MPDSYSPAYILMIQQEARLRFIRALDKAKRTNIIKSMPTCVDILRYWILIKYTNELVTAYLHEHDLRTKEKKQENNHEDGRRKA